MGVLLSNGPGDPATLGNEVKVIKALIDANYLIFGICLGHQLLAQAANLSTYKMHHDHSGSNHPVKNLITGHSEITSQNHGFAVIELGPTDQEKVEVTHINLNDNTVEGIRIKGKRAYSVQHHPEACPGPHDSDYMFDDFVNNLN